MVSSMACSINTKQELVHVVQIRNVENYPSQLSGFSPLRIPEVNNAPHSPEFLGLLYLYLLLDMAVICQQFLRLITFNSQ